MQDEILRLAAAIQPVEDRQKELLARLCAQAEKTLAGALRPGLTPEAGAPAFSMAAAWLAVDNLLAAKGGGEVESFSAGELTLRLASGQGDGGRLRKQAWTLMAPYVQDGAFAFLGVEG